MRVALFGLVSCIWALGSLVAVADAPPVRTRTRAGSPAERIGALPAPRVLRHTTFNIPFRINPGEAPPTEVQLYLSTDRGTTWTLYNRTPPQSGQFAFRAPGDGEYCFALRTVLQRGEAAPANENLETGLRVLVDSRGPQLDFQASVGAAGEVVASWRAVDPTLLAESFRIEYQLGEGKPWRPVTLNPQTMTAENGQLSGKLQWWPETASRLINIRAEIADQAENKTVVNRRIALPRVATNQNFEGSSESNEVPPDPYGSLSENAGSGIPWPVDDTTSPPNRSRSDPSSPPAVGESTMRAGDDYHNEYGPERNLDRDESRFEERLTNSDVTDTTTADRKQISNPFYGAGDDLADLGRFPAVESEVRPPVSGVRQTENATRPVTSHPDGETVSDPNQNGFSSAAYPTSRGNSDRTQYPPDPYAKPVTSLPTGETPRMTSAKRFQLDYDVDAVGPAGIAEVQLWGTRDAGRSWELWSTDPDLRSPIDVSVPLEGVYGFRVVVVGKNGLAGQKPSSGDLADLWIGVDTSRPMVRLTSAIYGEGRHAGQLDIRWTASDDWFSDRSITLQFSEHADGPWSTIASGIPNKGQYYWAVEPRIPQKIFLRIEARDLAGNVGQHQLRQSVSTTGLIPKGYVRGFRPY